MEYGKKNQYEMEYEMKIFLYGMEEILQYGIWKNRLPFLSIACPGYNMHATNCLCVYVTYNSVYVTGFIYS